MLSENIDVSSICYIYSFLFVFKILYFQYKTFQIISCTHTHTHTHTLYKLTSSFSHIINYLHFINVKHTSGIVLDPFQTNTNKFWISMTCYGMLHKAVSSNIYSNTLLQYYMQFVMLDDYNEYWGKFFCNVLNHDHTLYIFIQALLRSDQ